MHTALMKARVHALLTADLLNTCKGQREEWAWTKTRGTNPLALPAILKAPEISLSLET